MAKVIFRNSDFRHYRIPFYDKLCELHQVKFIFRFNDVPSKYNYISVQKNKKSFLSDKKFLFNYTKILFSNYDVFITTLPSHYISAFGIFISKIRRKKVIIWVEGWLEPSRKGIKKKVKYYFQKIIFNVSDAYFVTGTKAERFVKDFINKKGSNIFKVLQANIDMIQFKPNNAPIHLPRNHFYFLYFGRIINWKGLNYLLEAFKNINKKYSNTTLLVVGEGPYSSYCKALVNNLQIQNIIFHPSINDNDNELKVSLYNLCDVFLLPSTIIHTQHEGWGLTVGEAMSLGKPVIITDAVGCSEDLVFNDINGYIVKHGSVEELTVALDKIYKNKNKIKEFGKNSRRIFEEKISFENMAATLSTAVNKVIQYP